MKKISSKKGLAAMLDSLFAFSIAIMAIGTLALLAVPGESSSQATDYSVNVWAEDIADAFAISLDWNQTKASDSNFQTEFNQSINAIAGSFHMYISAELNGNSFEASGNYNVPDTIAVAKRVLYDASIDEFSILEVKVGI